MKKTTSTMKPLKGKIAIWRLGLKPSERERERGWIREGEDELDGKG